VVEWQVQVHLRRRQHVADNGVLRSRPHLRHGALEHLEVHLESDRRDRTMLLGAEQVAGSADLEVAERDLETLPQLVQPRDDV